MKCCALLLLNCAVLFPLRNTGKVKRIWEGRMLLGEPSWNFLVGKNL